MADGKPSIQQIASASQNGHSVKYEIVTYRGVEILIRRKLLLPAIEMTCEFTHDASAIQLAEELGIKLRKFR